MNVLKFTAKLVLTALIIASLSMTILGGPLVPSILDAIWGDGEDD